MAMLEEKARGEVILVGRLQRATEFLAEEEDAIFLLSVWDRQAPALSVRISVLLPLPGLGASPPPHTEPVLPILSPLLRQLGRR